MLIVRDKNRPIPEGETDAGFWEEYLYENKESEQVVKGHTMATNIEEWREHCLERDNHTCQMCGKKTGVFVHHIKPKDKFPGLYLAFSNGMTLCKSCHVKWHLRLNKRRAKKDFLGNAGKKTERNGEKRKSS